MESPRRPVYVPLRRELQRVANDLPHAPTIRGEGHTYRLVLGDNWRSTVETFGMLVGGMLPALKTVNGVQITGLTIKKASALLGAGTLTVFYKRSQQRTTSRWERRPMAWGWNVSTSVTGGIVFAAGGAVPIDNNVSERQMKRIALNRKNVLFVGNQRSDHTAAILSSLAGTRQRHAIDPQRDLTHLFDQPPRHPGQPASPVAVQSVEKSKFRKAASAV